MRRFGGLSRTTKILWGVTATIAVALVAVVVVDALWHRGGQSRRDKVARYIEDVDAAQSRSAQEANTISLAYSQFRRKPLRSAAQARDLARAEQAMRRVRARVAAVDAPPDARELRAQLLKLFDVEAGFAAGVKGIAAYFPRAGAIDARAGAAGARLSKDVAAAHTPAAQADAFTAYAAAAGAAARSLSRLRAPYEFDRARRADVARLRRLQSQAAQIASSLRSGETTAAATGINAFVQTAQSTAVAVEQRRAVIAYDRRLRAIDKQRTAVQNELARLERTL